MTDVVVAGAGSRRRRERERDETVEQNSSPLLDVNGAAEHLGVSVRFVRRLVDERRIPFVKLGKFVRFELCELDGWIKSQRVEPVRRGRFDW